MDRSLHYYWKIPSWYFSIIISHLLHLIGCVVNSYDVLCKLVSSLQSNLRSPDLWWVSSMVNLALLCSLNASEFMRAHTLWDNGVLVVSAPSQDDVANVLSPCGINHSPTPLEIWYTVVLCPLVHSGRDTWHYHTVLCLRSTHLILHTVNEHHTV